MAAPHLIAIAGGSCSGKTTLARRVSDLVLKADGGRRRSTLVIGIDSYYIDQSDVPLDRLNVDAPDAIDHPHLLKHLGELAAGRAVEQPVYDYRTHARAPNGRRVEPADLVIVEGLFALYWSPIRRLMDTKVFVEVSRRVALARRIARDVRERGRTEAEVTEQFERNVAPMYDIHVHPTRGHADLVLDGEAPADDLAAMVLDRLLET